MRSLQSLVLAAAIGLGGAFASAQVAPPAPASPTTRPAKEQAEVPVKVVVLFSSGVGYFEHGGKVAGDGFTEIRFKTNQINDILKSLILEDLGGGKVSAVVYPSQDPIAKTLRSFQIDITSNPSLAELLNQLRGAKVKLQVANEQVQGTILGLEQKKEPAGKDAEPIEVWVLNLISGASIRSIKLSEVNQIQLEDPQLQEELNKALSALAQARDQDKKPVTIGFKGEGPRQVRIGYVVETPIWKSSYRLIIPAGEDQKPSLQGWAIVENQTDNDWNNVQMSLVSGRPISFIQELYQPLYIPRPVVQPELYASLKPQTYDDAVANKPDAVTEADGDGRSGGGMGGMGGGAFGPRASLARKAPVMRDQMEKRADMSETLGQNAAAPSTPPMDPSRSVASVASASKMGELFQYTVGSVTLPRQRSAMIPIVTDPVEVEKLSIYNQNVLAKHPLYGARLKNTTDKHLLQGPLTVFDSSSYAGDARIDDLPPGQERLISYGIDLEMRVNAQADQANDTIMTGSLVKGVLKLTLKSVNGQTYAVENKATKPKTLILEHPRLIGWDLVQPQKPLETTETLYRFKQTIPAGKSDTIKVSQERVHVQEMAILPWNAEQILVYARNEKIPAAVREALSEAAKRKMALVETTRQIELRNQQIGQMTAEQSRIRDNMKTVEKNSQYYNRLLKKLDEQETQLEKLRTEIDDLQQTQQKQQKDLEDYISKLNVEK